MYVKAKPAAVPDWVNPILIANNQISIDAVGYHMDYREFTPAFPVLDSERGWFPGVQATASAMGDIGGISNVYGMAQFTYADGNTRYFAAGGPVTANTDGALVRDVDIRLGKGFNVGADWIFTPYFGAGYHGWDRDLSNRFGPFGYHEKYEHGYAGGGLLAQWAATKQLVLSASGLVGSTFSPHLQTSFNGGFPIPVVQLQLGTSVIYKAGFGADFAITPQWHVNAGVDYVDFRYGRSPVVQGILEPDSKTQNWTAKAGFGYSFYGVGPVVAKY